MAGSAPKLDGCAAKLYAHLSPASSRLISLTIIEQYNCGFVFDALSLLSTAGDFAFSRMCEPQTIGIWETQ